MIEDPTKVITLVGYLAGVVIGAIISVKCLIPRMSDNNDGVWVLFTTVFWPVTLLVFGIGIVIDGLRRLTRRIGA